MANTVAANLDNKLLLASANAHAYPTAEQAAQKLVLMAKKLSELKQIALKVGVPAAGVQAALEMTDGQVSDTVACLILGKQSMKAAPWSSPRR